MLRRYVSYVILDTMTARQTISPGPKLLLALVREEGLPAQLQLYTQSVALNGLIHTASLPQSIAKIVVCFRKVWLMRQSFSVCCNGAIKLTLLKEHPCSCKVAFWPSTLNCLLIFSTEQGSQMSRLVASLCYIGLSRVLPSHLACHLRASVQLVASLRTTSKTKV